VCTLYWQAPLHRACPGSGRYTVYSIHPIPQQQNITIAGKKESVMSLPSYSQILFFP